MALNNSQHAAVMRMFEQKQLHNESIARSHYEEVYEQIPELKAIDDSISFLSVEKAKLLLDGDTTALNSLKEELHILTDSKQKLLTSNGFSSDYLQTPCDCIDCRDTGYVNDRKCHCFKKAAIDLLYTQSNLKARLKEENFDTFSYDYYSPNYKDSKTGRSSLENMQNTIGLARRFIDTFDTEFQNIFFYGDTGVGKTFLSNCIAKELMDKSFSVIYFTAFELFDTFAKSRFHKDDLADSMYEHIFDCDLLIIDDLGTELSNSFTTSQLFLCLNERLLRKKSTIISTNLTLDALSNLYSERIFSRITSNYTLLKITGDDIRIKKKLMHREVH